MDDWTPTQGGGGPQEYIMTVTDCKPDSNQQDPTKHQITWVGKDHTGQDRRKSFSIGKDWRFDYASGKYVDVKGQPRGVNENTTLGVLLKCMKEGQPFDMRAAAAQLVGRGSPLSPMTWIGTRWHFARVEIDFGTGPRAVAWPIAFLGFSNQPMPPVNWQTPEAAQSYMASTGATAPIPPGQVPHQQQPQQYAPQQYPQQAAPQYQQQGYPPQQQMAPPPQQYPPQQAPQQQMAPHGYPQQYPANGGGPAAGQPFPGQPYPGQYPGQPG